MGCECSSRKGTPIVSPNLTTSPPPLPKKIECIPDLPSQPEPKSVPKVKSSKSEPPDRPELFVEDFIIVWLNLSAKSNPERTKRIKKKLEEVVNCIIQCTDSEQCLDFINDIKDEKILLVIPKTMAEEFVPQVQDIPQIDHIYYLDLNEEEQNEYEEDEIQEAEKDEEHDENDDYDVDKDQDDYQDGDEGDYNEGDDHSDDNDEYETNEFQEEEQQQGTKISNEEYSEVTRSHTSVKSLCKQIKNDVKQGIHNLVKPVVIASDLERIMFMYDQLVREIILSTKDDDLGGLYTFCKKNSENSSDEYFRELTKYSKKKAIYWYTKEGCLYKMTNRALRTRQYESLNELRHFIRDLHMKLVHIRSKKPSWPSKLLYRGQYMEKAEFEHIKVNKEGTLSFLFFLSTSIDINTAKSFIEKPPKDPDNSVRVLFKINVKKGVKCHFANIAKRSAYSGEKEWLFSIGSTFRIDEIKMSHDIQQIKLTAIDYDCGELKLLKEHFMNLIKDENICLSFGRLLYQLAKWEESSKIYSIGLEKETNSYRKAAVDTNLLLLLGLTTEELNSTNALTKYNELLKKEQKEDPNRKDLCIVYNNMATAYYQDKTRDVNERTDLVIANLKRAIDTYNKNPNGDLSFIATVYNNMACVLNSKGEHEQALVNNEKCIGIRTFLLPSNHPSLAIAYNSTAITYNYLRHSSKQNGDHLKANEYAQKAFEYAEKAIKIDSQVLPSNHPQIVNHKKNYESLKSQLRNLME